MEDAEITPWGDRLLQFIIQKIIPPGGFRKGLLFAILFSDQMLERFLWISLNPMCLLHLSDTEVTAGLSCQGPRVGHTEGHLFMTMNGKAVSGMN